MSKTQVAKKKTGGTPALMSEEMFAQDAGAGVADLSSEDLAIPFLKILQKMSPELDDIESAKSGDIINTVTKDIIKGKDGVRVVNCAYSLQYIEWEPRGTGTGAPHKIYTSAMRALKMRDNKGDMFIPPRFAHIWHLTTSPEENKNGSWHGWVISKENQIEDSNLYQEAKTFAELISAGAVKVQHVREENSRDDDDVPF